MTALGQMPQSPLGRMVASTPMQPASFTLLCSTIWHDHGAVLLMPDDLLGLPESVRQAITRWASIKHGCRGRRR